MYSFHLHFYNVFTFHSCVTIVITIYIVTINDFDWNDFIFYFFVMIVINDSHN